MKAICDKKTGRLTFQNSKGEEILAEGQGEITPAIVIGENTNHISQQFILDSAEAIYGLGQHQKGYMNLRGTNLTMAQNNTEVNIPVIVSSKNYGILWDNPSLTRFNEDHNRLSLWSEVGDGLNYYFIAGKNLDEVISGYRRLTGKAPLFGKWAYGLFNRKRGIIPSMSLTVC